MRRLNFIYLLLPFLSFVLWYMSNHLGSATAFFYGFAENKEIEISHNHDVVIARILVTPGQKVKKGQILVEAHQAAIGQKIDAVNFDLEKVNHLAREEEQSLRDRIAQLEMQRQNKLQVFQDKIDQLAASIEYNRNLRNGLENIPADVSEGLTFNERKLAQLKERMPQEDRALEIEIEQLRRTLKQVQAPLIATQQKLTSQLEYHQQTQASLTIVAPTDGIIGNISCREGENVPAFRSLLNFYEPNPTIAKGYVHEALIPEVQIGDKLLVASSLHPDHSIAGEVIGLGSRIVEIPERLRKIPDFKTYGREVLIQIPAENNLLQKEKVLANTFSDSTSTASVLLGLLGIQ